jgi:hypothetical protein
MKRTKQQIMLDMETIGTSANSVILSIAAVYFNDDGTTGDEFYLVIDRQSQINLGRVADKDIIAWWEKQSADAQKEAYAFPDDQREDTKQALVKLNEFILKGGKDVLVWGNGSDFDNALLADIFRTFGIKQPWAFWNNRCFRTFKSEFKHLASEPVFDGVKHHALHDAKHQVKWLGKIKSALGMSEDKPKTASKPEFTFGKYRGQLVEDIMKKDPDYIRWVKSELESSKLKELGL